MSMQSISEVLNNGFSQYQKRVSEAECSIHGKTEHWSVGSMTPICRKCEARHEDERKAELTEDIFNKYREVMTKNGIDHTGKKLSDWDFDSEQADRQKRIIAAFQGYAKNFKVRGIDGRNKGMSNILLVGGTGSGKTMLANALATDIYRNAAKEHIKNDLSRGVSALCRLITSSDVTNLAKQSWKEWGNSEAQFIQSLADTELLIIDDLGDNDTASSAEHSEADRGRIAEIVKKRYQKRPTVMTTNLTVEKVSEFLGDRAWDRLSENLIIVECNWDSYRQSVSKILVL